MSARTRNRPHRGQTLVFFALAQLVLLAALGLVLDGGYDYVQRRAMQNAADAAALAGARSIGANMTDSAVKQVVIDTAARNGVTDSANVSCSFITNNFPTDPPQPCSTLGVPMSQLATRYSGVQVSVAEQHTTFAMRAIGVSTSGTAATATAQVQVAANIPLGPFMVCGINTTVVNNDAAWKGGIFQTTAGNYFPNTGPPKYDRYDGYNRCNKGPCLKTDNDSNGFALFNYSGVTNPKAYAFQDGSLRPYKDALGNNITGPAYLIHDPSAIAVCNTESASFNGILNDQIIVNQEQWPEYPQPGSYAPNVTTGTVASVSATVQGINGCQVGQSDNCIMILPIVDNSGPGGTGSNTQLAIRAIGAFYVRAVGANSHTGQLVYDYKLATDGTSTWLPGSNVITSIRLIR